MGWWNAAPNGASLMTEDTGLVWGDGPADSLDFAFDVVLQNYQGRLNRKPTTEELEQMMLALLTSCWGEGNVLGTKPESMDVECMGALDKALMDIISQFQESWERSPKPEELVSGVRFSAAVLDDDWADLMEK